MINNNNNNKGVTLGSFSSTGSPPSDPRRAKILISDAIFFHANNFLVFRSNSINPQYPNVYTRLFTWVSWDNRCSMKSGELLNNHDGLQLSFPRKPIIIIIFFLLPFDDCSFHLCISRVYKKLIPYSRQVIARPNPK